MGQEVTVSEARASLPRIVERVQAGEEVTLTRHGRAVAVVVRPDRLRSRRADAALAAAEQLRDRLDAARMTPLPEKGGLTADQGAALLAEVQASRDDR